VGGFIRPGLRCVEHHGLRRNRGRCRKFSPAAGKNFTLPRAYKKTSNEMTNFVYLFFGDEEIYLAEAAYSIGTLLKRINPSNSRVIIYTDQPARVRSLPVVCESIAGQVNEMKGPFGFGFRVKICTVLKCAESFPGNIVFLDCDTFVKGPIQELADELGQSHALMFKQERLAGRFPQYKGFQMQLPDGTQYRYGPQSWMFNSGVIGFHHDNARVLRNALAICDELFLQGRRPHISEQFAISEAFRLAGVKILETHQVVAHYYRGSAKRYMHYQLRQFAARPGNELWNLDRPIPYSYPRVQWFKLMGKVFK
jgi:hypothetical protein